MGAYESKNLTVETILNLILTGSLETTFANVDVVTLKQQLGNADCIAVKVKNPYTLSNGTQNTTELVVGDRSQQEWHLIPNNETPILFVPNLSHLWIRKQLVSGVGEQFPDSKAILCIYTFGAKRYK